MTERRVWRVSAIIEAAEEDARKALEAIGQALCPNPEHEGFCSVPWTTMACAFDDLDEEEKKEWREDFAEHRRRSLDDS